MFKISFDFNETSKQISNVKIKEVSTPEDTGIYTYELEVEDNKLKLYPPAIEKLKAATDDRISIQYVLLGVGKSTPVIGKAEVFTDALDGNKLNKAGTIAFRGEKRNTLLQFGDKFNLEPYKDGIWKLVPIKTEENVDLTQEQKELEELDQQSNNSELDELLSSMDDLPF